MHLRRVALFLDRPTASERPNAETKRSKEDRNGTHTPGPDRAGTTPLKTSLFDRSRTRLLLPLPCFTYPLPYQPRPSSTSIRPFLAPPPFLPRSPALQTRFLLLLLLLYSTITSLLLKLKLTFLKLTFH